jgi:uncharacterized membrane protein (DUF106 family)
MYVVLILDIIVILYVVILHRRTRMLNKTMQDAKKAINTYIEELNKLKDAFRGDSGLDDV